MTTKARRKQRSCLRKHVYKTQEAAESGASEMKDRVIYDKLEPQAYACHFGNHFHVGHGRKYGH